MVRPGAKAIVFFIGAALALSGCAGSSTSSTSTPTGTLASATPSPQPTCLTPADAATVTTANDTEIVIVGKGPHGVVLAPQLGGDNCGWMDEVRRLAKAGYHVATFSWALDQVNSVPSAAAALTATGVTKIVLIGASAGGGMVLDQAAGLTPPAAGVIGVSPVHTWQAQPGLKKYSGPLLLLASKGDTQPSMDDIKADAKTHPGREETLLFPDIWHGVQLVLQEAKARKAIDTFLARHLR
jgi:dienelactone hydrolase